MALLEKEFVVKNGLDIKTGTLKLDGISPTANKVPAVNSANKVVWKDLLFGQGIDITNNETQIIIRTSSTISGNIKTSGDLTVGIGNLTWTSNGSLITINYPAHGLENNTTLPISFLTGSPLPPDANYTITKIDNDNFTIPYVIAAGSGICAIGGSIVALKNILILGTATFGTSVTITGTPSIIAATVGNNASIFNTTTGSLNIGGASPSILIGNASSVTTFGNTITHKGVTLQSGIAGSQKVDTSYSFTTASIILDVNWVDSGIAGSSQLMTGLYTFRLQDGSSLEYYAGVLPWYSGNGSATLLSEYSEIPLYKVGDGSTGNSLFMRILRTASGAPKIQLASTSLQTTRTYTITFRKLID